MCKELDKWLEDVNKTGPPGNFMAWVYQHRMLPRILQPLRPDTVLVSEATLLVVKTYGVDLQEEEGEATDRAGCLPVRGRVQRLCTTVLL